VEILQETSTSYNTDAIYTAQVNRTEFQEYNQSISDHASLQKSEHLRNNDSMSKLTSMTRTMAASEEKNPSSDLIQEVTISSTSEKEPFTIYSFVQAINADSTFQSGSSQILKMAITSWLLLIPPENIILLADDDITCDLIRKHLNYEIHCERHDCMNSIYQKPLLDCMLKRVFQLVKTDLMVMINSDIILKNDFPLAIHKVMTSQKPNNDQGQWQLMIGQRTDIPFLPQVGIKEWEDNIDILGKAYGEKHGVWGLDYWVFRKTLFFSIIEVPSFLVGAWRWDNHLLSYCIMNDNINVIDATLSLDVFHYGLTSSMTRHENRRGSAYNDDLTQKLAGLQFYIGNSNNADQMLIGSCLKKCDIIENPKPRIGVTLLKHMDKKTKNLALLTSNWAYIKMTKNWICWAQKINFTHFIILSEDLKTYRELNLMNIPVIVMSHAPEELSSPLEYGSKGGYTSFRFFFISLMFIHF